MPQLAPDTPPACGGVIHYEVFEDPENAILREKQIKAGSRQKKIDLVNSINRKWLNLYKEL